MKRDKTKLNEVQVQRIRDTARSAPNVNPERLGKEYGVSVSTIKAVLSRKTWKQVA